MTDKFSISTALFLPVPDYEALLQGRTVVAISRTFQCLPSFFLFPFWGNENSLIDRDFYRPAFRLKIGSHEPYYDSEKIPVRGWANFEGCRIYTSLEEIEAISRLTPWTDTGLKELINERQRIFLAFLRVYQLPQAIYVPIEVIQKGSVGKFIRLPNDLSTSHSVPVLSDQAFSQHVQRIERLEPPPHPELEKLEFILDSNAQLNLSGQLLRHEIRTILCWQSYKPHLPIDEKFSWINEVAALGNRSKEEDQGKSNYQAGTDFEITVRNSLEYLGFKIDYAHRGGAGGLDLSCSRPYTLVGECKSGKKIPNDTAVQLLNLGTLRLPDKETYRNAVKIIIGPGEPTDQLEKAAMVHGMSIINPTTLENLVKLHHQYPGSVDLFQLKEYLADGRADDEVDKYISKVREQIALRAHIIGQVKHYLEDAKTEDANVDSLHAVYVVSKPKHALSRQEFYEILVELASPLAGYLGRRKDKDGSDRFYFLRDLLVNR
jgi:hypothetical protein